MSVRTHSSLIRRPWHLWLVAILVFALYVGGARDYVLIFAHDTEYIRGQFGPDGLDYFSEYPVVLRLVWTLNILGGLLAPVLLLVRVGWAHVVAVAAAAAQIVLLVVTFAFLDRWRLLGAEIAWFDIGIGVVTVLFAIYSWRMRHQRPGRVTRQGGDVPAGTS